MIKFISFVVLSFTALIVIVYVTGYFASVQYTGTLQTNIGTNPQFVWQTLIDISDIPKKKKDVESVQILASSGQLLAWQENLKNGGFRTYKMTEFIPEKKLTLELMNSSYGLKGFWTFELEPQSRQTLFTITENSTLTNVRLRGIRTIFGRDYDLLVWLKYIKVGTFQSLITTP